MVERVSFDHLTPAELFAAYQQIVAPQETRRVVPSEPIASSFQPIAKGASVPLVTSVGSQKDLIRVVTAALTFWSVIGSLLIILAVTCDTSCLSLVFASQTRVTDHQDDQ